MQIKLKTLWPSLPIKWWKVGEDKSRGGRSWRRKKKEEEEDEEEGEEQEEEGEGEGEEKNELWGIPIQLSINFILIFLSREVQLLIRIRDEPEEWKFEN